MPVRRSHGIFVAPFSNGAVAYDAVTDTVHLVGPVATRILLNDDPTVLDDLVNEIAAATGEDTERLTTSVIAGVESMRALGLVDRHEPFWVAAPVTGPPDGDETLESGKTHVVLDRSLVFRSADRSLLDDIDSYLGSGGPERPDSVAFDVHPQPTGRVRLRAAEDWDFTSRENFFAQLPGVLNDFAARSHTLAVLHAGGVRTPAGHVLVVSGAPESGKSTLVGALVQAGCDYLGDEMIGLRSGRPDVLPYPKPLELDEASCAVLGVEPTTLPYVRPRELRDGAVVAFDAVGPVRAVVFPSFRSGSRTDAARLDPESAVRALLEQTLNLKRITESGLRAVCHLAETAPVSRIAHGDSVALARALIEEVDASPEPAAGPQG